MAYVSKENKAKIVAAVKPVLAKFGMKGSFSVRNHSTIVLKLKSGKLDIIGNYVEVADNRPKPTYWEAPVGSMEVNMYHIGSSYSGKVLVFLEKIELALKAADWFDKSDSMTDYFHTAYYIDVHVGEWKKPYVLVK